MSETQETSQSVGAIFAALAKAQGEIEGAAKDRTNPHFKSAYADLASVWDACRSALSKNGLAVTQITSNGTDGATVTVITMLGHSSGEWIRGVLTMVPQQATPQGIGSCLTYARRYALAAIVGVAPEDDDGNAASGASHDEAPAAKTHAIRADTSGPAIFRFGKLKGQPLSAGTARDLGWYGEALAGSIADPAKATYRESNERDLAAVRAEQTRRASAPDAATSVPTADELEDDPEPAIGPEQAPITKPEADAMQRGLVKLAESIGVSREDLLLCERGLLAKLGIEGMGSLKRGQLEHFAWAVRQAVRSMVPV